MKRGRACPAFALAIADDAPFALRRGRLRHLRCMAGSAEESVAEPDVASKAQRKNENELSETDKRANVIRLVFGGDVGKFQHFCDVIRDAIPAGVGAVLRGSAITGVRWKDGARFDAEGPRTSDLDLTLVGGDALKLFRVDGFYVPGIHSRPLSDKEDPAIAPELVPLRENLMMLVGRPVNIQATADLVMFLRGDLLGQPYLTLVARAEEKT